MERSELIARIDGLKDEIDAMRPLNADRVGRIMQKFRLDWNYHSSNIEGNSLTYGETRTFLLHGLTANGKPWKDHLEIKGHNEAVFALEDFIHGNQPLTEHWIKTLHQVILGERYQIEATTANGQPTQRWVTPGRYKQEPNHVRTATGETFYFAMPEDTPAQMEELLRWYNAADVENTIHPLELAARLHYRFIRIHPFDDGNGRVARILMNLVLMKAGFPPAIIRTEDKDNYYRALRQADGGDIEPFVEYVGQEVFRSLEIYLRGARGEDIEDKDDVDKEVALFKAELATTEDAIPKEKRSTVTLTRLLRNSIEPLIAAITERLAQFDELFSERTFRLTVYGEFATNSSSFGPMHLRNEERTEDYHTSAALVVGLEKMFSNAGDLHKVVFTYEWKGYKHAGVNAFGYDVKLEFLFDEYAYTLRRTPGWLSSIKNLYHQGLSREQIDGICCRFSSKGVEGNKGKSNMN